MIAGSDCGFGTFAGFGAVDPEIAWAKLAALAEGAAASHDPAHPASRHDVRRAALRAAGRRPVRRPRCTSPRSAARQHGGLAAAVLAHAPPRFALAGLSMGGIVAMEIVARPPTRVERLALLDTNPLAETPGAGRRAPQIAKARAPASSPASCATR